jgi:hypothetical protein
MSQFSPISIVSKKVSHAPIAKQLAAFEEHKRTLINMLQKGHKTGPDSEQFDADKSWGGITRLARLFFWSQVIEQNALPTSERIKRLQRLSRALRQALGVTRRAIGDSIGNDLYRAYFARKMISLTSALEIDDGNSSDLTRTADEIKEMVGALDTLEVISRAAANTADVLLKTGRPALLPGACIQGLARVYRTSTGAKPGRGAGPFADFAYEFMTAVGQTNFDYRSLTDAVQEAHRQFKPSWFDEKL